eukprot:9884832-Alexandrium_andersonii.AAC.1
MELSRCFSFASWARNSALRPSTAEVARIWEPPYVLEFLGAGGEEGLHSRPSLAHRTALSLKL